MEPELRDYKIRTLNQLLGILPEVEQQLAYAEAAGEQRRLSKQVSAIRVHIERLNQELHENRQIATTAEDLCRKAARAIVGDKLYLAKKTLQELETIEPFYPGLDRLKQDVAQEHVSRRTYSIAEGNSPAFLLKRATLPPMIVAGTGQVGQMMLPTGQLSLPAPTSATLPMVVTSPPVQSPVFSQPADDDDDDDDYYYDDDDDDEPRPWWATLFQFHIIASCMTVVMVACGVVGVTGMVLLNWLIEGS